MIRQKTHIIPLTPYTTASERGLDIHTEWVKIKARSKSRDLAEERMISYMEKSAAYKGMTYEEMMEYAKGLP
jgi:hypothetical protein